MADDNTGGGAAGDAAADPIKNLKSEFSRKFEKQENQLSEMSRNLQTLIESVAKPASASTTTEEEDLATLSVVDPKAYAMRIINQAKNEIRTEFHQVGAQQTKLQATLASVVDLYPELQYNDNPLTKKTIEIYNAMDKEDQRSPMAYKLAAKEAADELGVKPRHKRTEGDDFVGPSSGGSASRRERGKPKLDEATRAFAEIMEASTGIDLTSKEAEERLVNNASRKWNTYQQIPTRKKTK